MDAATLQRVIDVVDEDHDGETLRDYVTITSSFDEVDPLKVNLSISLHAREGEPPPWVGEAFLRMERIVTRATMPSITDDTPTGRSG